MQQNQPFVVDGKHLPLTSLQRELCGKGQYNRYLNKEYLITTYPRPELRVPHVSHSTDLRALWGIGNNGGFKDPNYYWNKEGLVWFSLTPSPDELQDAMTRDITLVPPGEPERVFRPERAQAGAVDPPPEGKPLDNLPPEGKPLDNLPPEGKPLDNRPPEGKPLDNLPPEGKPLDNRPPEGKPLDNRPPEGKPLDNLPPEGKPLENRPPEGKLQELRTNKRRALAAVENLSEEDFAPKKRRGQLEERTAEEQMVEERTAEERRLEELKAEGWEILQKFASSPAFKSSSRYGSFRFTFSLRVLLQKYSQQDFCGGQEPVLRVYRTVLYKQEVMYAVLVHSPTNQELFSHLPLLEETPRCICAFRAEPEPHFIWRPQAMSETHRFELVEDGQTLQVEDVYHQFYVWDHVTLALHVDKEVLRFEERELRESVRFCEADPCPIKKWIRFQLFGRAEAEVKELWPEQEHLLKFSHSQFHITD